MPGFDDHLRRLQNDLRDILRDRIAEAVALSRDNKAFAVERWVTPKHAPKKPDRWIKVYAQDEGGCQIYLKFKPKSGKKNTRWASVKKVPLLNLTEAELLSLKRYVWHPNDPENPLVVLAKCAK